MARLLLLAALCVLGAGSVATSAVPRVASAERGAAPAERGAVPTARSDSPAASRAQPAGKDSADCSVAPGFAVGALPALERLPVSITSGGRARTFLLVLPHDISTPRPLLLAVSGALDDAAKLLNASDVYPEGPASVHVDAKATAAGFVVLAPNSLCDSPVLNNTCVWGSTTTPLDPVHVPGEVLTPVELSFFADAARCVRDVLRVPLSGDVYALGFSQGGKLVSRFGCEGAAASGGELRVRAVAAAEALYTAQPPLRSGCAAGASDANPPPLLLFQSQNDDVVPFCTAGRAYDATSVYWNDWAGVYGGCMPATLVPNSGAVSSPIMQALCAPDAPTLPPASMTQEMVATGAARATNATRLLRVYTNGLKCARPQAMFWTYEATGHRYPGPMEALGGMDFTDVALRFFVNVRDQGDSLMFGDAEAFAPMLSGLAPCTSQVAPPALLPAGPLLRGYSAGPCLDLEAVAGPPPKGGMSF